jgi:hypothetical protein
MPPRVRSRLARGLGAPSGEVPPCSRAGRERGTDAHLAPTQDDAVTSDQRVASPPSPSVLCGHPRHHDAIPGTAAPSPMLWEYGATRRRHASCCAPYGFPSANVRTTTKREAPTSPPSKPLVDGYRARHDALLAARFSRTVVYSATLCAIPLHVIKKCGTIVSRLPLACKRRGWSPSRGRGGQRARHTLTAFTTILAFRLNQTSGTWRPCLLFRLACSSPLQAPQCDDIVPRAHHCWTYGPGQNQDKHYVISCLAPPSRDRSQRSS